MVEETDELKVLLAEVSKAEKPKEQEDTEPIIDVLNLPPRSDVHKSKPKRMKMKINSPIARFVFVLLIISVIIFLAYYYLGDDIFIFKLK
ncbi:MAG TPA: hypothetical protein VK094_09100 [Pseudogracilibacillus sp.]|nr:hypothetical protein [Pseudogracilibacillus sp.]